MYKSTSHYMQRSGAGKRASKKKKPKKKRRNWWKNEKVVGTATERRDDYLLFDLGAGILGRCYWHDAPNAWLESDELPVGPIKFRVVDKLPGGERILSRLAAMRITL